MHETIIHGGFEGDVNYIAIKSVREIKSERKKHIVLANLIRNNELDPGLLQIPVTSTAVHLFEWARLFSMVVLIVLM